VLLGSCSLAILPLSCSRGPQTPVLATVGDRSITAADFQKEIAHRLAAHRPIPSREMLLQEMVDFEVLLQRARAAGLAGEPQVQREINSLLVNKLQERELTARQEGIRISSEDARAEYEKNLTKYTHPAKTRLALLTLAADAKMTEAKRAELRERMAEARRKALAHPAANGFGTLAIDYSDDQASRYRGGDVGWLDAGNFSYRWPHEVLETGFALEKDRVSDLIETKEGVYLVMKTDSRPGSTTKFEEVLPLIQQSLLVKRRHELQEAYRQEVLRTSGAKINPEALAKVELPAEHVAKNRDGGPPGFPVANESLHGN
jgi:parvulin-like peptidyl-prolyl isomerase